MNGFLTIFESTFEKENETIFSAKFYSKSNLIKVSDSIKTDLNKIENEAFPFSLNPTEAILEFNNKNKIVHLKIVNIKMKSSCILINSWFKNKLYN